MKENRIRVAFVPLNSTFIGLPRALLFNMLFRDSFGGKIILRIDDTDMNRAQMERLNIIFETLHWLGINWDEGPDIGGPYSPYIQSSRKETYCTAVEKLLQNHKAYRCFCNNAVHGCSGNCYQLNSEEVNKLVSAGKRYCIRYRISNVSESYIDLIHGQINKRNESISDPVVLRSDGTPTFHLATAVDEGALHITHIIRGVDHIDSAFIQRQIMRDLGTDLPEYAHFSIFVNEGESIYEDNLTGKYDAECLRKEGFLRDAIVNYLITSGYMPKGIEDCTLYKYSDFVKSFSLGNFSLSNQKYDYNRLVAINRKWIKSIADNDYIFEVNEYFRFVGYQSQASTKLLLVLKDHLNTLGDLIRKIDVLYDCSDTTSQLIATRIGSEIIILETLCEKFERCDNWDQEHLRMIINENAGTFSKKRCYETIRQALTNTEPFGSILEVMEAMGKELTNTKITKILKWRNG